MEDFLNEDCPFEDETTEFLKITGAGTLQIISREQGIAACTESVAEFHRAHNIEPVNFIPTGQAFDANTVIYSARGPLRELFRVWRVSQTLLSITCAIAKKTDALVTLARRANPDITVATTRKTHPGMRKYELCAVRAGGGEIHRNSLSDSILVTTNHLNVSGQIPEYSGLRHLEIEARSMEEALKYVARADILLLDHFELYELEKLRAALEPHSRPRLAVTGDIDETNIEEYARVSDIIVTSAPYYATPLNMTAEIHRSR
ncbi:MAG: nicotinate-nucleotide pyrophosphorylase [Euryarchaeota archaeon]|nr:nicotinate-nucleotide pyrophosphorylase [Euryarchaeota archaeon]